MRSTQLIFSLLPYLCLIGTILAIFLHKRDRQAFGAIIAGSLAWSLLLWFFTNLLSLFNAIERPWFIFFWSLWAIVLIIWLLRLKPAIRIKFSRNWLLVIVALVCLLTLLTGIVYPPNFWDALSYHLPRVMEWIQNRTLAPYWTPTIRQIGMPPFNAMIALQSLIMGAGDYFVNLGQWLAFLGCIAGVAHLTGKLGGSRKAQIVAAFFMALMPSAMMQASNTESTNIVTFWILAFVSLCMDWRQAPSYAKAAGIGLCLGFAILSKGSAYPIGLPFVIMIGYYCLRQPRKRFCQGLLMAFLIVALNFPHLQRTYAAYHSIVGGTETNILFRPTPSTFAVNSVYNFLVHEPFILKYGGTSIWSGLANLLGVDEDDAGVFPWGGIDQARKKFKPLDAYGQNSLYAFLVLIMAGAVIIRRFRPPGLYSWLVLGSFASYCLFLTWHPWTGRIHTTLFALATPLVAIFFTGWRRRWEKLTILILACLSAAYVFCDSERPLAPLWDQDYSYASHTREELYITYPPVRRQFMEALRFLAEQKPDSVALALTDDAFEYPIWAYLAKHLDKMPDVYHWGRDLKPGDEQPEYIWFQNRGDSDHPLADPFILKRAGNEYKLVFGKNQ